MSELNKFSELKETVDYMLDPDYKRRFIGEYYQTLIRYTKLETFLTKIYQGKVLNRPVPHDCPEELLELQSETMQKYLAILKIRAKIEGIDL